ncbi:hypothetical protein [Guptibacillus hwajinpoensis]|uniref:hypothetical protein n=1 Tax=Guptibacillus hwajinpoensis TaxID=208199 RepID=UPI001CFDF503|nr:hypothetical protein [Pseudalkalibacillus hwajinpoensis]WLR60640.1 hypothetical protein LC071_04600 [Pseudalkalibacillus hwajinpoensis]
MDVRIIEGELSKKARSSAYHYLKDLYRKEKINDNDWNLHSCIDRGTSKKRLQPKRTTTSVSRESGNE